MIRTLEDIDLDYKKTVEEELKKRLGFEIPNSTLQHAVFVQTKLIENTEQNLGILTGDASEINHPEIKTSLMILVRRLRNPTLTYKIENRLVRFFNKSKTQKQNPANRGIRIIMYNAETDDSRDFRNFFKDYADIVQIKKYKPIEGKFSHFLVSDSIRYRKEDIHFDKDFIEYKINSEANFNNASIASVLEDFFNNVWGRLK